MLTQHHRKVKSEQVITFQMVQQLKTKNINVMRGLLCRKRNAKFLLETYSLYDHQDKFQSVTDTDNGFPKF